MRIATGRARAFGLACSLSAIVACSAATPAAPARQQAAGAPLENTRMQMTIGAHAFTVELADTAAARAFAARLPFTLDMAELNGNEKHADIHPALPVDAQRPGTIRAGDVMLYGANTIVVFYRTFPSSYRYTWLGRVQNIDGLAEVLGPGGVRVVFARD
ncbi:cyclophilin-like fold protein [Lysobacter brunescens]|uniref:Cyclophilin-like fold protein n=1 Tax=Lysobacter brunescens TaxID=262323 RepID=A0ABW2Y9L3_9GAMM